MDDLETRGEAIRKLKSIKPPFPVYHDATGAVKKSFKVEGLPLNVALDATGKIVAVDQGDPGGLEQVVAAALKGAKPVRASR